MNFSNIIYIINYYLDLYFSIIFYPLYNIKLKIILNYFVFSYINIKLFPDEYI